jgi:hypothetical protein
VGVWCEHPLGLTPKLVKRAMEPIFKKLVKKIGKEKPSFKSSVFLLLDFKTKN